MSKDTSKTLDEKIDDNFDKAAAELREARARMKDPGATTRGGGAGNSEARRRRSDLEEKQRQFDRALAVRNARNERRRTGS